MQPTASRRLESIQRCGSAWRGRFHCRSPICTSCRHRYIRLEQRLAYQRFGHFIPAELAHATILIRATPAVDEIEPTICKARQDLKNRLRACRRHESSWDHVWLTGWWIVEATPSPTGSPIWWVSAQAIVFKGDLTSDELRAGLERQWRKPGQVVVRPFPDGSVERTLDAIIEKANAHTSSYRDDSGVAQPWPRAWVEALYGYWCARRRNTFEALRFSFWPLLRTAVVEAQEDDDEIDPMPFFIA